MARDTILEKGLPANQEAERAILGAIFLDNELYEEAAEHLDVDDFFLNAHRIIWSRIKELRENNQPIDMIVLSDILQRHGEIESIGGVGYLSALIDGVPERPSIKQYVRIVKRKAMLRGLVSISQNAITAAIDDSGEAEEVIAKAEMAITELTEATVERQWVTFGDSLRQAGGLDSYLNKILDPAALSGTQTRYEKVDNLIGGLIPKTLYVIAARPSMGKTAFAVNVCDNITERNVELVIGFFSLEMSREKIEYRFLSSMSKVNLREFSGRERSFQWDTDNQRLSIAIEGFLERRIFIDDTSYLTPQRLRSKCRQLKRREGRLDLVVVDYLQLMSGGARFENRTQEVSAVSRGLKAVAKDLDCPVIALAQLSRAPDTRSDKRPQLSDLRESGSIEQDADVVAFIHRQEVYDKDNTDLHGLAEINIAKNRDGATDVANLCFLKQYTRFENLALS
jgi:replicative DNA helicase